MRLVDLYQKKREITGSAFPIEKRSSGLATNSQFFIDNFTQLFGANHSGQTVTDRTAMSLAPVHACVRVISEALSSIPLKLYVTDGNNKNVDKQSPAAKIIEDPNTYTTGVAFRKYMIAVAVLRGNSYAYIFRDRGGNPINLLPLQNCQIAPMMGNGELFYQISTEDTLYKDLPKVVAAIDMVHIKGLCISNQFSAISPVQYHAETIGIDLAAMASIASTFKTGNKKFMVMFDKGWNSEQMGPTVKSMENVLSNEKLVFGVPSGTTAQAISLSPAEAGYLEAMGYTAKDIARIFGVPASMIGADDGANKTSTEQDYLNFINQTLLPWAVGIEAEFKKKLLAPKEKEVKQYKHNFNSLLRADASARAEFYSKMLLNGVMNRNEVRAFEDMNPYSDGEEFMVPFNEVAASQFTAITQAKIDSMDKTIAQINNPDGNN